MTASSATSLPPARALGTAFKVALSGLLIFLVWRNIDLAGLPVLFANQSPGWVIAAAAVTVSQIVLGALRWDQVLRALALAVSRRAVLSVSYMGVFFNAWLLGNIGGDAARAALAPTGIAGRAVIVHSVLFDRVLTIAGLGLVALPLVVFGLGPFSRNPAVLVSLAVCVLPFMGLAGMGWITRIAFLPGPVAVRGRALARDWWRLCRARGRLACALAIAIASQIAIPTVVYCLAQAQHVDLPFVDLLVLMPPVVILVALPISAGGWGLRENLMVAALAPIGVAADSALLVSVQMGLLAALLSLPAGLLWLVRHGLRPVRSA